MGGCWEDRPAAPAVSDAGLLAMPVTFNFAGGHGTRAVHQILNLLLGQTPCGAIAPHDEAAICNEPANRRCGCRNLPFQRSVTLCATTYGGVIAV